MNRTILFALTLILAVVVLPSSAQETPAWNFNVGGGVGFPIKDTGKFVNDGGNFSIGAGPNFGRFFGLKGEFMWQDLPLKQEVLTLTGSPDSSSRASYGLTGNLIFRIPTGTRLGLYAIGGGGWYHASGELTTPTVVPGTVCSPFWGWWGACTTGLIPVDALYFRFTLGRCVWWQYRWRPDISHQWKHEVLHRSTLPPRWLPYRKA